VRRPGIEELPGWGDTAAVRSGRRAAARSAASADIVSRRMVMSFFRFPGFEGVRVGNPRYASMARDLARAFSGLPEP